MMSISLSQSKTISQTSFERKGAAMFHGLKFTTACLAACSKTFERYIDVPPGPPGARSALKLGI
jgi:hypothetical protein